MSEQVKIKIPFGKVASFAASLVVKARGGFTKEEGHQLLAEFMELLADVLAGQFAQVPGTHGVHAESDFEFAGFVAPL
jgi:hypothetical protein